MKKECSRIPIKACRDFVKTQGLLYAVIFARGTTISHVVTYGNTIEESEAAAKLGNQMKKGLSWPASSQAMPPRVVRNQRALAEKIVDALFADGGARRGEAWSREGIIRQVEEIIRT